MVPEIMIEGFGTVVSLASDRRIAVIRCHKQRACDACPTAGVCYTGKTDQMQVEAINEIGAKQGDQVKIATTTGNFLRSSFILYILPVFGLLVGAFIGQPLGTSGQTLIDPPLLTATMGVTGLTLTFLLIRRLTHKLRREEFMPRIVAVVNPEEI